MAILGGAESGQLPSCHINYPIFLDVSFSVEFLLGVQIVGQGCVCDFYEPINIFWIGMMLQVTGIGQANNGDIGFGFRLSQGDGMGFKHLGPISQYAPQIIGTAIVDESMQFSFWGHIPNFSVDQFAAAAIQNAQISQVLIVCH